MSYVSIVSTYQEILVLYKLYEKYTAEQILKEKNVFIQHLWKRKLTKKYKILYQQFVSIFRFFVFFMIE